MGLCRVIVALALATIVSACSVPGPDAPTDGIHDPYEDRNRRAHAFNTDVDGGFVAQAGALYVREVPADLRTPVSAFADHLSLPRTVVNQVLQGRLLRAGRNTLRFGTNTLIGFGGFVDIARDIGMPPDETDFGETLHVWGVPEGAYLELPLLGPATERDVAGRVVDLFLNPLDPRMTPGQRAARLAVRGAALLDDRAEYAGTIDDVIYDSADSYSQLRLFYLQNRRFELGAPAPEPADMADPLALDTEGF